MKRRSFLASLSLAAVAAAKSALGQQNGPSPQQESSPAPDRLRIVTWNVACGQWCTPREVANALVDRKPDLVLTNETPKFNQGMAAPDWSGEIARHLGLTHVYVGSVSSAHHRAPSWGDVTGRYGGKFKSILSRWPISNTHDYTLEGEGWSPASAIRVQVRIGEADWAVYSLHVPGQLEWEPSKHRRLAEDVLAHEPLKNLLVGGDFNVRTESKVLSKLKESAGLENAITERAIDHILYRSDHGARVVGSGIDRGPEGKGPRGGLSDHPYAWAELMLNK